MSKTTDFGFTRIPIEEKAKKVAEIFHSVASRYDVMNDLMSFGIHRLWKRFTIQLSGVKEGQHVLDVAGGTGDLTMKFADRVGARGSVLLTDINESMLSAGRDRLLNAGYAGNVLYASADAENLPFPDHYFDCISIAFGLRNVTNKDQALKSMLRVLKPGGRLLVLEFSKPVLPALETLYDYYSFNIIPKLGGWVTGDVESYQYLVESIRCHPDQETLKQMMEQVGFHAVAYYNLSGGIVALHRGFKH